MPLDLRWTGLDQRDAIARTRLQCYSNAARQTEALTVYRMLDMIQEHERCLHSDNTHLVGRYFAPGVLLAAVRERERPFRTWQLRLATGALFGLAAAWLILPQLELSARRAARRYGLS